MFVTGTVAGHLNVTIGVLAICTEFPPLVLSCDLDCAQCICCVSARAYEQNSTKDSQDCSKYRVEDQSR